MVYTDDGNNDYTTTTVMYIIIIIIIITIELFCGSRGGNIVRSTPRADDEGRTGNRRFWQPNGSWSNEDATGGGALLARTPSLAAVSHEIAYIIVIITLLYRFSRCTIRFVYYIYIEPIVRGQIIRETQRRPPKRLLISLQ